MPHQSCVVTRRPWKSQNAVMRAVGSPRAQKQLRDISIGRRMVSSVSMPWLGVVTCAQQEHRGVAVAAQWDLLQRRSSAVRYPIQRHGSTVGAPRGRTWSPHGRSYWWLVVHIFFMHFWCFSRSGMDIGDMIYWQPISHHSWSIGPIVFQWRDNPLDGGVEQPDRVSDKLNEFHHRV